VDTRFNSYRRQYSDPWRNRLALSEGLTISGNPLKDHRDVDGHASAVNVLYNFVQKDDITANDLFDLHRLVISEQILDVYKPAVGWKRENNSTNITVGGKQTMIEYSNHWEVPELMKHWLDMLNTELVQRGPLLDKFSAFCEQNWQTSIELVEQARILQRNRDQKARNAFTP